jgi:ABC-type uncharacterized transport system involved in gliding motility auxiliary subunit
MTLRRILDGVAWLGTVLVFGALVVPTFAPELQAWSVPAAWAGIACIAAYTLGQWREILDYFRQRNARYGALAGASVLIVVGLLVAVNYLAARRPARWDLTTNRIYSLSDQTTQLLAGLDAPVRFLVFDVETNFQAYRMLDEYDFASDLVDVEYVDADRNPARAQQYEIDAYGTIVIEYADRTERVSAGNEQTLTNGLIRVLTGEERTVYFVQGHGERDITSTAREGYTGVTAALGRDNYASAPLVLAQAGAVPDDASVVVVAGPTTDLLEPEIAALAAYLDAGGHLLVLLDPPGADGETTPQLTALLAAWGIEAGQSVVVDGSGMGQLLGTDASVPVVASYPVHPITAGFNVLTAYPMARAVTAVQGGVEGRFAQSVIETTASSWAETNIALLLETGEVAPEPDQGDIPGPVSLAAAVTAPVEAAAAASDAGDITADDSDLGAPTPESRLLAIGDSDFAANYALGIQGNQDLFVNGVSWLAQQEDLIAIRPRDVADTRLTLTASQLTGLFWLSLLVVPATVFGVGVFAWSRRRQ